MRVFRSLEILRTPLSQQCNHLLQEDQPQPLLRIPTDEEYRQLAEDTGWYLKYQSHICRKMHEV